MGNPWLDIPSSEYIGHMGSAEVAQLPVLNRLVRDVLATARPRNVLLLGCSTGNGLEHVDPAVTRRVSGIDINPQYLRELAGRFSAPGFQLDLHAADVATYPFAREEFDLVHAALLFEYVEWPRLVPRLADALCRLGLLSIVLQSPSDVARPVFPTKYRSIRRLESLFQLVDPLAVVDRASDAGLYLRRAWIEPLRSGKAFTVLHFTKTPDLNP